MNLLLSLIPLRGIFERANKKNNDFFYTEALIFNGNSSSMYVIVCLNKWTLNDLVETASLFKRYANFVLCWNPNSTINEEN